MIPGLCEYYTLPKFKRGDVVATAKFDELVSKYGHLFVRHLAKSLPIKQGKIQYLRLLTSQEVQDRYLADTTKDANSGWPVFASKLDRDAFAEAIASNDRHDISIKGQRYQRGKLRAIFMAAFRDMLLDQAILYPLMDYFQEAAWNDLEEFSMWNGPMAVGYAVAKWNSAINGMKCFVQIDVKSMDKYVNEVHGDFVANVVSSLFGAGKGTAEYEFISDSIHRSFTDRLILDPALTITQTPHSLFSGKPWTQMVETVLADFLLFCATQAVTYLPPIVPGAKKQRSIKRLDGMGRCHIDVVGDDSNLGFSVPGTQCEFFAPWHDGPSDIKTIIVELYAIAGLVCEPSKCDVTYNAFSYCKRLYRVGTTTTWQDKEKLHLPNPVDIWAPIYPCSLALNSILNPEKVPENVSLSYDVTRTAQILDACIYNPYWDQLSMLVKKGQSARATEFDPTVSFKLAEMSVWTGQDDWDPATSPSLKRLLAEGITANTSSRLGSVKTAYQMLRYGLWFFNITTHSALNTMLTFDPINGYDKLIDSTGNLITCDFGFPDTAMYKKEGAIIDVITGETSRTSSESSDIQVEMLINF